MSENGQEKNGYENRLIEDRYGKRRFTLNALRERAVQQFTEETFGRTDILLELDSPAKQHTAVNETIDYVLAADYVAVSGEEKAWLRDRVYHDLFRLGGLDTMLSDESVTEISVAGPQEVFVRHGFGELERFEAGFETQDEFAHLLQNVLTPLGIDLSKTDPFLEVGITLGGRAVRFSLMGPPMMPFYNGQIRLHPAQPRPLTEMNIPPLAIELLQRIITGGHGLLIVGDGGVGKTTLLANLLGFVPESQKVGLVQRAREVHPAVITSHIHDYTGIPKEELATAVFEAQIHKALEDKVGVLFLDEIHGDEGGAFWRALNDNSASQLVATFRGKANTARLHSAVSMAILKTHRTLPQEGIDTTILQRLPFVVVLSEPAPKTEPRLVFLGQWSPDMQLEALVKWEADSEPVRTETTPGREL